jgi:hypothetical protein
VGLGNSFGDTGLLVEGRHDQRQSGRAGHASGSFQTAGEVANMPSPGGPVKAEPSPKSRAGR